LNNYSDAILQRCKQEALSDLKKLTDNILQQLEWSDTKLLRALLVFADTQSWMKKPSSTDLGPEIDDTLCFDFDILLVSKLAFSLPFSNGRAEQIFSRLKTVKTKNRTSLSTSTLDDLLEIYVKGPPLKDFDPESAVELWWRDCTRRPNQEQRKTYRPRANIRSQSIDSSGPSTSSTDETDGQESSFTLDDWDEWFIPMNN
jgi:hypothetical protein